MRLRDLLSQMLQDLRAGFELLTRISVPSSRLAPRIQSAWTWPVIGVAVGVIGAIVGYSAVSVGLSAQIAAILAVIAISITTGALHEDGLADCADGFFGGRDKARRLAIMKDSQIGSYGTLALILVVGLRVMAISSALEHGQWQALIVAAVISRAMMAGIMAGMENARGTGFSHSVGRPSWGVAAMGVGLASAVAVVLVGLPAIWLVLVALILALAVAAVAQRKIGGQTGDVCGAVQQICEVSILVTATVIL
jgi:adenosylcobinamide-GDP ribazoletransferase